MNTIYWLALTFTPGIGSVTARKLIERFRDIESIFAASPEELASIPRIFYAAGDISDSLQIGHGGAAIFLHNERHGIKNLWLRIAFIP